MNAQRGFTLIELLAALSIMAVVVSLLAIRLGSSEMQHLKASAEKLSSVLEQARDEALMSGRSIAVSSDGSAYQLWQMGRNGYSRNEWFVLKTHENLEGGVLPENIQWLSQQLNGKERPLGERLIFPPDGLIEPFSITLAGRNSKVRLEMDLMGRVSFYEATKS